MSWHDVTYRCSIIIIAQFELLLACLLPFLIKYNSIVAEIDHTLSLIWSWLRYNILKSGLSLFLQTIYSYLSLIVIEHGNSYKPTHTRVKVVTKAVLLSTRIDLHQQFCFDEIGNLFLMKLRTYNTRLFQKYTTLKNFDSW